MGCGTSRSQSSEGLSPQAASRTSKNALERSTGSERGPASATGAAAVRQGSSAPRASSASRPSAGSTSDPNTPRKSAPSGTNLPQVAAIRIDDDPLAALSKGISLRGLRKLRKDLITFFGASTYSTLTTHDINTRWVQAVTRGSRCRVAEDPALIAAEDVGVPMYFISHAWKNRFELLLSSVEAFLTSADEETRVWIDILAVNQHRDMPHQARDVAAFKDVVRVSSGGTLVVLDLANINPARRAWCVYEWAATLALHGPDGLHLHVGAEERATLVSSLDVTQAECYNAADKDMILADVVAQHGSTDAFNYKLRLQLLLEPLSYTVDVRRLTERSAGTNWRFGPVEEWLGPGPGSGGPRALVVAGGAGEGKSTVSATLVASQKGQAHGAESGGGSMAERITAYHFLKYNDQRRLDPVRIVKSLAFQLALKMPALRNEILGKDAYSLLSSARDVGSAVAQLLLHPLHALAKKQQQPQQVVILIDALDEAEAQPPPMSATTAGGGGSVGGSGGASSVVPCGNKAFQLISRHLAELPPFVRFFFTTRPDAVGGQVLPALDRLFAEGGGVRYLTPEELRESAGVSAEAGTCGDNGQGVGGGVMVYHTVADEFLAPAAVARKDKPTLADLYELYNAVFSHAWAAYGAQDAGVVSRLLEAVLAAQEPLPQSRLQALGLARMPAKLPGWPVLFTVEEYHLYTMHKSLADWMAKGGGASGGGAAGLAPFLALATANGHLQLARQLAGERTAAGGGTAEAVGGGGAGIISPSCYKYLVRHLVMAAAAKNSGAAKEAYTLLEPVLYDYEFLASSFHQDLGRGLIDDLAGMGAPPPPIADALHWLLAKQHELQTARDVNGVLQTALMSPSGTAVYRRACEYYSAQQAQQGRPGFRLVQQMGGPPTSWPALRCTMKSVPHGVLGVAFSPDGRTLASSGESEDGMVRLWSTSSGSLLIAMEPSGGRVDACSIPCVAFSLDGRTVAAGTEKNKIELYDVTTGLHIGSIQGHKRSVSGIVFARLQGEAIIISSSHDRTVRLWRCKAAASTADAEGARAPEMGEAPMPTEVRQLDQGADWECFAVLEGHTAGVSSVAATHGSEGFLIVSGGGERAVRLWQPRTAGAGFGGAGEWQCTATLEGHVDAIESVAVSPDGRTVASGGAPKDKTARLWQQRRPAGGGDAEWQCVAVLRGHVTHVTAVKFIVHNGLYVLATGGGLGDEMVRLWVQRAAESGQAAGSGANGGALTGDGNWRCAGILKGHERDVLGLATNPANSLSLASCGKDASVRLWDLTGALPDLMAVAAGKEATGAVPERDENGIMLEAVWVVAFSPHDGKLLATANDDKTVRLWELDAKTGTWCCTAELTGHNSPVQAAAISRPDADGRVWVASGGGDKTVKLWRRGDTEAGGGTGTGSATGCGPGAWKCVQTLKAHTSSVCSIAFGSPVGGPTLLASTGDKDIKLWSAPSGGGGEWICTAVLKADSHEDSGRCLTFRHDGLMVAAGGWDGAVRLWSRDSTQPICAEPAASWKMTAVLKGHQDAIWGVAFSPDGSWLAAAGWDKCVSVWRSQGGGGRDQSGRAATETDGSGSNRRASVDVSGGSESRRRASGVANIGSDSAGRASVDMRVRSDTGRKASGAVSIGSESGRRRSGAVSEENMGGWVRTDTLAHGSSPSSVCFSPDGRTLASGSGGNLGGDCTIRLFRLAANGHWEKVAELHGHEKMVWGLAFNPVHPRFLASCSEDTSVRLWEVLEAGSRAPERT